MAKQKTGPVELVESVPIEDQGPTPVPEKTDPLIEYNAQLKKADRKLKRAQDQALKEYEAEVEAARTVYYEASKK